MANSFLEAFGITSSNLGLETSVVMPFVYDQEKPTKFCESYIQRVYKLTPQDTLGQSDRLVCSSSHIVQYKDNSLYINNQYQYPLNTSLIDLSLYTDTLYILLLDRLFTFNIETIQEQWNFRLTQQFTSMKIKNFGSTVYLFNPFTIMKVEDSSKTMVRNFQSKLISFDNIIDSYSLFCVVDENGLLEVLDFEEEEPICSHECQCLVTEVLSISDNTILYYSCERFLISGYNFKEKQLKYSVFFNSKCPKQIHFCEKTEQVLILNRNSTKFMVLSFDENSFISKYLVLGLKTPSKAFEHCILENTLRGQAIYEGDAKHKIFTLNNNNVEVYILEVLKTNTLHYRFGKEPDALYIYEDLSQGYTENSIIEKNESFGKLKNEGIFNIPTLDQADVVKKGHSIGSIPKCMTVNTKRTKLEGTKLEDFVKRSSPPEAQKIQKVSEENKISAATEKKFELNPETEKIIQNISDKMSYLTSGDNFANLLMSVTDSIQPALRKNIENSTQNTLNLILSGPLKDTTTRYFEPLQNSLFLGLQEMRNLQNELNGLLNTVVGEMKVPNKGQKAGKNMVINESIEDIVSRKDKLQLKKRFNEFNIVEILNRNKDERFVFGLGYMIVELIREGVTGSSNWLQLICENIEVTAEDFSEFYMKLCNNSSPIFNKSIEILSNKF